MKGKIRLLAFVSMLLLSTCLFAFVIHHGQPSKTHLSSDETDRQNLPAEMPNPYHMIVPRVGEAQTSDPAWGNDIDSQELIFNVYETLIRFDMWGRDFVPLLATEWTVDPDNLIYTFTIRESVPWHDPAYGTVTAEDVEYSFERVLVLDKDPAWMLYEPLLDCHEADLEDPDFGQKIDNAITSAANTVTFYLVNPSAFPQIIAQTFCSIVDKEFCTDHEDWPGWDNDPEHTDWVNYHDLEVSPLDDPEHVMMGTGPYKFDYWDVGVEWSVVKNDNYWRGWPAEGCRGYLMRATVKVEDEWSIRKLMFLIGDADILDVPEAYMREIMDSMVANPGEIRGVYPHSGWPSSGLFERFWVQGRHYELLLPGIDFYHLWKEDLPGADTDSDGNVDAIDVASVARAFWSFFMPRYLHRRWDCRSDANGDTIVNIRDVFEVAKQFGFSAPPWTPP